MDFKTLINKTADTVKFIMTQPTMIFRNKDSITLLNNAHVVDKDECARPDLIALQYYGNQSKLDMILKWNGISDPFSINEGDILEIPSANTNFFKLERPKEFENNPVKQQFVNGKRLGKKDQRRLDALKKKYGKDNLLPPNVIPVGKKNYEFVGTKIRMGAQVQTDAVVNAITSSLNNSNTNLDDFNLEPIKIEGANVGVEFEKIPGGVWLWTGSDWVPVNPEVAQEIAGSLYNNYGNPNGNIKGSFEGQLYFDKLRDNTSGGDSRKFDEDKLVDRQGNVNATGPVGTSVTSGLTADTTGTNQNDGGNTVGGSNTNTSANNDIAGITPGG